MQLSLGTAQFGMDYGIRPMGRPPVRPSVEAIHDMLDYASGQGVSWIDTGAIYGEAEPLIGAFKGKDSFMVLTKLWPNLFEEITDEREIRNIMFREIAGSLARLGRPIDAYLMHSARYVFRAEVVEALKAVREAGLAGLVGVSCYEPQEAFETIKAGLDCFQAPFNALDQRFVRSGAFLAAKDRDLTVFARQPFLQSLLLMARDQIPQHLAYAGPHIEAFWDLCGAQAVTPVEAALHFVLAESNIDVVVFGVESLEQLHEDIGVAESKPPSSFDPEAFRRAFLDLPQAVINPSLWAKP